MSDTGLVLYRQEGDIGVIVLNRPEKRNAIHQEMMEALEAIIADIATGQDQPRAVVVQANGPLFSAGIDLVYASGLLTGAGVNLSVFETQVKLLQGTLTSLARLPMPTVALLNGACIGLGLELALACDLRLADEDCRLALPEVVLSLVADCGGTTRSIRTVGAAWARYLLYLGEEVSGKEAKDMGLVHQVTPAAQLLSAGMDLAARLARKNPVTLRQFKTLVAMSSTADDDTMLRAEIDAQRKVLSDPGFAGYLMQGMVEMKQRNRKG